MSDMTTGTGGDPLLDELAELYETLDPVPDDLADDVRIAITVQALRAEIAQIVAAPPVPTRAEPDTVSTDSVTFTSGALSLMVQVADVQGNEVTIDGWVTAGGATIEVHIGDTVIEETADEFGRFVVTGAPRGRTWFVVRRRNAQDEPPIVTPAIEF